MGELVYLPARMVGVERLKTGRLRYRFSDEMQGNVVLTAEETLHIRIFSKDGILGQSPLMRSQGAVSLSLAQQDLAESQASRRLTPDLAFSTDRDFGATADLSDAAFDRLKRQLSERIGRMAREPLALLLEAGLKPTPLTATNRDSQMHEARLFQAEEICRIYGVPLSVVGLGKQTSYGSLTEESRSLRQNCFSPWSRRVEAQLQLALLSEEGRRTYTLEHDLSGLERGDLKARMDAWAIGIQNEVFSANEIRRWEGLASREGGDAFRNPAVSQAATVPQSDKPGVS